MGLFSLFRGVFSGGAPTNDAEGSQADQGASLIGRGRPFRYDPYTGDGTLPPDAPGLYYFRNEDGEPQYIGETSNIRRRMEEHMREGHILEGEFIDYKIAREDSTSEERRDIEAKKIQQHKPQRNQRGGRGGRKAQ